MCLLLQVFLDFLLLHWTAIKAKVQRGWVVSRRPHSWEWCSSGADPGAAGFTAHSLHVMVHCPHCRQGPRPPLESAGDKLLPVLTWPALPLHQAHLKHLKYIFTDPPAGTSYSPKLFRPSLCYVLGHVTLTRIHFASQLLSFWLNVSSLGERTFVHCWFLRTLPGAWYSVFVELMNQRMLHFLIYEPQLPTGLRVS